MEPLPQKPCEACGRVRAPGLFHDEHGGRSASRIFFGVALLAGLFVWVGDAVTKTLIQMPEDSVGFFGVIFGPLALWAGGKAAFNGRK